MKKFKVFIASLLTYLMILSLVPTSLLEMVASASENEYKIFVKNGYYLMAEAQYENKSLIAYIEEGGEKIAISLVENGKEISLKKIESNSVVMFCEKENSLLGVITVNGSWGYDYDENNIYETFDFNTNKFNKVSYDEFKKFIPKYEEYTFDKIKDKNELEKILNKINQKSGADLTINDKVMSVDEYDTLIYSNDKETIKLSAYNNGALDGLIEFKIQSSIKDKNNKVKESYYNGVIYGDYIFNKTSSSYWGGYKTQIEGQNLYILDYLSGDKYNLIKLQNGKVISEGNIELPSDILPYLMDSNGKICFKSSVSGEKIIYVYGLQGKEYKEENKLYTFNNIIYYENDIFWIVEESDSNLYISKIENGKSTKIKNVTKEINELVKDNYKYIKLTVFNEDNIRISSFDRFIIVQKEGKQTSQESGWNLIDGNWYYLDESGNKTKGWLALNDKWYYLNDQGQMMTSWNKIGNAWYYLKASGEMATGWNNVGSSWYFMNNQGVMQTGWLNDKGTWYYLNSSGAMSTGWSQVGSTWYFMNGQGVMQTGWLSDKGTWYYLNGSGAMTTGWNKVGSSWYLMNGQGQMMTGWNKIGNDWYYLKSSGEMVTGWQYIDSTWYWFNEQGIMA